MSALTNAAESALLRLLFQNTDWSNIGDATGLRGSAAAGNWHVSLHYGSPGEGGDQTTNETGYLNYARVAVGRSGSDWIVAGNSVNPLSDIEFPTAGLAAPLSITHSGIGTAASGSGNLIMYGAVTPSITVAEGTKPVLTTSTDVTAA